MEKRKLSNPQLNIYDTQKTFPNTAITNIGGLSLINGYEFNKELWKKAINMYMRNNDSTRIRLIEGNGEPLQYFDDYQDMDFEFIDLSNNTEEEKQELYSKWMREEVTIDGSQIRFKIIKFNQEKSGFFLVANHLISDAVSVGTLGEQINRIYTNLLLDENYNENIKPSYNLFLDREEEYKTSDSYKKDQEFWNFEFSDVPTKTSISSKSNIANNVVADRYSLKIGKELTQQINEFCSANNVSVAVLFESIVFAYMNRVTGDNNITIGSPSLNRVGRAERQIAGMFVSTLPFKIELNDEMNFDELFSAVTKKKKSLFKHQKYPYSDIQESIRKKYGYTGKLFDVVVSYQNAKIIQENSDIDAETLWIPTGASPNELIINIDDRDSTNELNLNLDYQLEAFSKFDVENISERLLLIVKQVIENSNIKISDVNILTEKDLELYKEFNASQMLSTGKTIHELFEEQVILHPDEIALIFEDKSFTYRQLNAMANSLAHTIRELNLNKDEIIPIVGERDFNIIISMLAVAKAGHSYFVIDYNEYPNGRVDTLLSDFKPKVLIKNKSTYHYEGARELDLSRQESWSDKIENLANINDTNDKLCLIHTSGSTGLPKTAVISHDGVVNMARNHNFLLDGCDYSISMITMSFDAFQQDTYLPLINGKTLVLSSPDELKSISGTEKLLSKYPKSFTVIVPSRLEQFLAESETDAWKNIHSMILGGELILPQLLATIREKTDANLYNFYGSAETTVCNCGKKIVDDDTNIGKPLPGFNLFVIDKNNNILPIGATGEIAVAGIGIAQRYLNRPELTDEKFVQIGLPYGIRAYKTGDYGVINNNIEMVYKGRRDEQVKFNGIRIELKEIENVINSFPNITKSAVAIKKNNDREYLCAFYVANQPIDIDALMVYIEDKLPLYMIPQFFNKIDSMPTTNSGKLNKNILPDFSYEYLSSHSYTAPTNDIQKAICSIWEEILEQEKVGISNTFSSLGGTSKDMIKMLLVLEKRLQTVIQTRDVPKNPTILVLEEIIHGKKRSNDINENWDLSQIVVNKNKNYKNAVLLAGATGYLGSHLLYELLTNTDQDVYCLIRDKRKFDDLIKYYFENQLSGYRHRIHLVDGDITKENLGLELDKYKEISQSITQVFNSASNVKHYGAIEDFKDVNVTGVYNLLKLCADSGAKMHHISTLSVSGHGLTKPADIDRPFTEDDLDIGQKYKDNPYVWTKYLAEKLIREFQKIGVESNVYRVGTLDKRSYDDKFQINQDQSGFQLIVESVKQLGMMPNIISEMPTYVIPVDVCAEIVVKVANRLHENNTYHIFEPELKKLSDYLKSKNFKYEEVGLLPFITLIENLISSDSKYVIISKYLNDYMANYKKIEIDNSKTIQLLQGLDEYQGGRQELKVYLL